MKNPLRYFCKSRGLSDLTVHHGDHQSYNQQQPQAPSFLAPPPTSQSLVPAGYPTGSGGYGYNNYRPAIQPPTAYPYSTQQQEEKEEEEAAAAAWEFNAGNNVNKKGQQKAGHIKVGNNVNGVGLPINLPKNGRFVFNAGGNTNDGDMQEAGNIEFGNVEHN